MLILLKFNTVNQFFQYNMINIPDINVLQRKIPVHIVLILAAEAGINPQPAL